MRRKNRKLSWKRIWRSFEKHTQQSSRNANESRRDSSSIGTRQSKNSSTGSGKVWRKNDVAQLGETRSTIEQERERVEARFKFNWNSAVEEFEHGIREAEE